ncbi:MAG: hypothetical protein KGN84_17780 [Acidobacteriota bacterium]|nr:hypothetical protein [Acidobacteriota bacterium]
MIADLIVFSAIAFAVIFTAAWAVIPALRARIEQPKFRFLANVQSYEQSARTRERSA